MTNNAAGLRFGRPNLDGGCRQPPDHRFRRNRSGCTWRPEVHLPQPSQQSWRRLRARWVCGHFFVARQQPVRMPGLPRHQTGWDQSRSRPAGGAPGGLLVPRRCARRAGQPRVPQCHRRDKRLCRQELRIAQPRQQDDGRSVENATSPLDWTHQLRVSRYSSTSLRRSTGSMTGKCLQRRSKTSAVTFDWRNGRSSATGLPSRVIVMRSPRETRSMTRPPRLRKSRMVTSDMPQNVSPVRQAAWNAVASACRSWKGGTQKGTQSRRQITYSGGTQRTANRSRNETLNSSNDLPPVPGRQGVGGSNPPCSTKPQLRISTQWPRPPGFRRLDHNSEGVDHNSEHLLETSCRAGVGGSDSPNGLR